MNLSPQYNQQTEPKQCKSEDDIRTKFQLIAVFQIFCFCTLMMLDRPRRKQDRNKLILTIKICNGSFM